MAFLDQSGRSGGVSSTKGPFTTMPMRKVSDETSTPSLQTGDRAGKEKGRALVKGQART